MTNPYHTITKVQYGSFKAASAATGILGLNSDNCGSYGFVLPTTDPKPETEPHEKATRDAEPTENQDGTWSYKWTVETASAEDHATALAKRRRAMIVDRWSFATAAMAAGLITAEEAQAWGPGTSLPVAVDAALIAAIPQPGQLAAAKVRALASPRIGRANPLIEILRTALGLTETQIDDLFATAKALEAE